MLETPRLYLREQTVEDLNRLYEIYEDASIRKFVEPLYADRQEETAFTEAYIRHMYRFYGYGLWVVCLRENDRIIGRAGLGNRVIDGSEKLELGYLIAEEYQRQGYALEACEAICSFAATRLEADEIACITATDNEASAALLKKLGFEHVASMEAERMEYYVKQCCS